jgi:hypothetical protein
MTAGSHVGLLLERLMVDPSALVERVVQPVLEQLWRDGAAADDSDTPPDLVIATALGNRLAQVVANDQSSAASLPASSAGPDRDLAHYELLLERNGDLAAALGACDCWGEQLDCPVCDGAGRPGWVLPDRRMFAAYVYPAVRAVKKLGAPSIATGHHAHDPRKENGHVERMAR